MPIRLSSYSITGSTLTYTLNDVVQRDPLIGSIPFSATLQGEVVTVELAAMPPELDILL